VDRFLGACLAKDPALRPQRIQKVLLELKLLSVAARHAEAPAPVRADQVAAAVRAEIKQMEDRVAARLEEHEGSISELDRSAGNALNALREQIGALSGQMAEAERQAARLEETQAALGERLVARVEESLQAAEQRLAALEQASQSIAERLALAEQNYQTLRDHAAALQESMAADLGDLNQKLHSQAGAIESARTAVSQTDDLVERIVEALELLQASVAEQAGERAAAVN
jgi:chromosome segregation ATPase